MSETRWGYKDPIGRVFDIMNLPCTAVITRTESFEYMAFFIFTDNTGKRHARHETLILN